MSRRNAIEQQTVLPLFLAYEISVDERSLGNLVDVFDTLPRFIWSGKHTTNTKEMMITKEGRVNDNHFKITFTAATIRRKRLEDGVWLEESIGCFPGLREEMVEDALRKLSVSGYGNFVEGQCWVVFKMYDLFTELKQQGHCYSYTELEEALTVLAKAHVEIETSGSHGTKINSSPYLPQLSIFRPTAAPINEARLNPAIEGLAADKCVALLHPLISQSILDKSYRMFDFSISMSLTSSLARYLFKILCVKWRNAAPDRPYTFSMMNFLVNSPRGVSTRMPENLRAVDAALKQLLDNNVLSKVEKEVQKKPRGKGALDYVISLYPTESYVKFMKRSNAKFSQNTLSKITRKRP